jgi:hypothetical protein
MGDATRLTPEQVERLFRDFCHSRPGSWVVVDLTAQGPRVIARSENVQNALTFAKARGGIVVQVPPRAEANAGKKDPTN